MQIVSKYFHAHNSFVATTQGSIGLALFLLDIYEIFPPNSLEPKVQEEKRLLFGKTRIAFRLAVHFSVYYAWIVKMQRIFEETNDDSNLNTLSKQQCLGIVLSLSGHIFYKHCKDVLGKFFTYDVGIMNKHELIQKGPYKYIRHPGYAGLLLYFLGDALYFDNIACYCSLLGHFISIYGRTFYEETVLTEEFKDEYEAYKKRTWRLIPFIL